MIYLIEIFHSNRTDSFLGFISFGKKFVVAALERVGWDSKPDGTVAAVGVRPSLLYIDFTAMSIEGHTDKLLRSTIMGMLDTFAWNDPTVYAEAKRRFDLHFSEPTALPAEYKTTVYRIVLMNGGVSEYEQILKTYTSTEDNQERKYAMYSLGAAMDTALKTRTLDWAVKSGGVKLQVMR